MRLFFIPILRGTLALLCASIFFLSSTRSLSADETHRVRPGETLSHIALQYGTTAAELRRLNNLPNADFVHHGQYLVVRRDDSASAGAGPKVIEDFRYYQVQPGDTLSGLARHYGISLVQIVELNGISPAQKLYIGQIVKVPGPTEQAIRPKRSQGLIHLVQPGEYLGLIAERYQVSVDTIAQENGLVDPSQLLIGQALHISTGMDAVANGGYRFMEFPTVTEKWIDVDLSKQQVVAYEGMTAVKSFIISSGRGNTPTVTGTFRIWAKIPMQDMQGGNRAAGNYYYLEDVPYVQYFFENYSFHGTYWHDDFGTPMSRGCINMKSEDAKWLFDWTSPRSSSPGWLISDAAHLGTLVQVHY